MQKVRATTEPIVIAIPITAGTITSGLAEVAATLPLGAVVTNAVMHVTTAFNGGATNTINIGDQVTATAYGTNASLATVQVVSLNFPVRVVGSTVNQVRITPTFTTTPTVGSAIIIITMINPNYHDGVND